MARRAAPQCKTAQAMAAEIEAAEGKIELPSRYTKEGIAERREHVWRLYSRRVPQTVIAQLLGVSRRTIASDLAWIHEQNRKGIESIKNDVNVAHADIGMTCLRLEGISAAAMNDYELARTSQMKNLFLNTALRAELAVAKVKLETGTWPHRQEDVRISHSAKITFEARMGEESPLKTLDEPSSRRRVLDAVHRLIKAGKDKKTQRLLEAHGDDGEDPLTIDVDPIILLDDEPEEDPE